MTFYDKFENFLQMAPTTDSSLQPEDLGEHQGFDEKWESKGRGGSWSWGRVLVYRASNKLNV